MENPARRHGRFFPASCLLAPLGVNFFGGTFEKKLQLISFEKKSNSSSNIFKLRDKGLVFFETLQGIATNQKTWRAKTC